jgi:hypothetical protein
MRAWFAGPAGSRAAGDAVRGGDDLLEVPDCTSVGRAVDSFVAWSHGRQVLTAPDLLRAVDFGGFDVEVRLADPDALAGDEDVEIAGERATVGGAMAVERVLGTYPPRFERLFDETAADVCVRRREGGALYLDGRLVGVSE